MATLLTAPPLIAFNLNPISIRLVADGQPDNTAYFQLTVTAAPSVGETFRIQWGGNDYTLTIVAAEDPDANLIAQPSGSASAVADALAEAFRRHEAIHADFRVVRTSTGGEKILLDYRVLKPLVITLDEQWSGVTVLKSDSDGFSLNGIAQIYSSSDAELMASKQAPFLSDGTCSFDISDAFADLEPSIPLENTINPSTLPSSLSYAAATDSVKKYYMRVAEKTGSLATDLLKTDEYLAILGGKGLYSDYQDTGRIRHNYPATVKKPVTCEQPDYVYILPTGTGGINVWVVCKIYWNSGAVTTYAPFGTTTVPMEDDMIYWFPSGYMQMKLNTLTPPVTDDYILAYDWMLYPLDDGLNPFAVVQYAIDYMSGWDLYLLYENGVGGMETVALRGKGTFSEQIRADNYKSASGLYSLYGQSAQGNIAKGTGWKPEWYNKHIRQILLGKCWIADTVLRRFLPVIVEPAETEWGKDDETLFGFEVKIRMAWEDPNFI